MENILNYSTIEDLVPSTFSHHNLHNDGTEILYYNHITRLILKIKLQIHVQIPISKILNL